MRRPEHRTDEREPEESAESADTARASSLATLQGSLGNAAVGRMLSAGRKATGERAVPIAREAQSAIDSQRAGGAELAGDLREQMETVVGADLGGTRLHTGAQADALTSGVGALAFTQGRDVFLRSDQHPASDTGRETLTHELQHVAEGAPASGAVLRAEDLEHISRDEAGFELAAMLEKPPIEAEVTEHPSVTPYVPTIAVKDAPPPGPKTPQTFDIKVVLDNVPQVIFGVTGDQAIQALDRLWGRCHDFLDVYRGWHADLMSNRADHPIIGFWADKFGNGDPPDIGIWNLVGREELSAAKQVIGQTAAQIGAGFEKSWAIDQQQTASSGLNLNMFQGGEEKAKEKAREDYIAHHVREAADLIQKAANIIEIRRKRVFYYKEGQIAGAERGIAGTKMAINVMVATASGGVGELAEGGLVVKAGATALTQSGLSMYAETMTQAGEMFYGDRAWGDFDVEAIKKVGKREAVNGFLGALVAGKLTKVIDAKVVRYIVPALEDAGINLSGEGIQLVAKATRDWMIGQVASPLNTTANVIMDVAIDGKQPPKDWGEYWDRVSDDFKTAAISGGITIVVGNGLKATHGVAPSEPGGGGSGGGGGGGNRESVGGGGGGGGSGGEAVPASPSPGVDPYARTAEIPAQAPPAVQRGNAAIGSARTLRPGELAAQTGDTAAVPSQVDPYANTGAVPAQVDPYANTGTVPAQVDPYAHTGEVPAQVDPLGPTGQVPAQDIGTAPTGEQPVQGAPEPTAATTAPATAAPPVAEPAAPGTVRPVEPADASRMAANPRQKIRAINGRVRGDAKNAWEGDYKQGGDPPAAWVDDTGTLVIDSARVKVPLHPGDVPAPGTPGPTPSPESMIEPPESLPSTPSTAAPSSAPAGPRTAATGPVTAQTGPVTAAEEIPSGPRTGGSDSMPAAAAEPAAQRPNWRRDIWALEIEIVTNDPVEATALLASPDIKPMVFDMSIEPGRMAELWQLYGGEGPVPAAFTDNAGGVFVDAARVPHALDMVGQSNAQRLQGPLPDDGAVMAYEDPLTRTSEQVPVPTPPAYSREVARVIADPVEASRMFHAENDAGRVVWLVKDASIMADIWNGQYGQTEPAPPAWINGAGVLTVDVLRVDVITKPPPEVPVAP